jgi:hypothetical protein
MNCNILMNGTVIKNITFMLPKGFPTELSDKIFQGMKIQAKKLTLQS